MMNQYPVYEVLQQAAIIWPQQAAVHDEEGTITFQQLFTDAEALRTQLTNAGVQPGMAIGLKAKNGRDFITGLFAIAGTGATALPIYHQLKAVEIDELVQQTGLHAWIDDHSGTVYDTEKLNRITPAFSLGFSAQPFTTAFAPFVHQPAFVRFTSGTTGTSKGVIISHQSVIERIDAANNGLQLGPGDTVVWVLPMAYHFVVSIVLYVKYGAAIAVVKDFLAKNIMESANKYQGTLLYSSPVQVRLLANDTGTVMMPSLKKVISTSAGISPDVCMAFKNRFGVPVSQAYGIIEIGLPMLNFFQSEEHPEAVGYPVPGYEIAILDEHYQPLANGEVGQLGIKGPGMFDAYLHPVKLREEVLVNGYFLTADFASKSADGLVKVEGRAKSVINISGIKVFPEEVEAVLETYPGIAQARVNSEPHRLLGQIIVAAVIVKEQAIVNTEDLIQYCRKRLSNFKAPQKITVVDSLPTTKTGKLQRP
jgi:long-chain acyl-CoA synthetase